MSYLLTPCCCTAVQASEIGLVTQVLEVSVIGGGGDIPIPSELLGCLRIRVLSLGPYFHTCQSPTLLNCFGQVMHILGIEIALIFPNPSHHLTFWAA